jgi:hypothetical protein
MSTNTEVREPQTVRERFAQKFGKASDEELASVVEQGFELRPNSAGCDGCDYNIFWREEIWKFVEKEVSEAEQRGVERGRKEVGYKVKVWFNNGSPYQEKDPVILENITEIHYNYPEIVKDHPRIAFESDIDGTGYTYMIGEIREFEALLPTTTSLNEEADNNNQ